MNLLVFYFSGTGNTWWLIDQFRRRVQDKGHSIEILPIEQIQEENWNHIAELGQNADQIGIGYPIYGSSAPKLVHQFVSALPQKLYLPEGKPKPAFVLTTMELFSGDGALILNKRLLKAHLELRVAYNFQMVSNLGVPVFNYNPCSEVRFKKRQQRSLKKLDRVVDIILSNGTGLENRWNPLGYFLGWLQRVFMNSIENQNWKYLGVDATRCTQCMQCVRHCPTHAITVEDGEFQFGPQCTACYRCYNFCPAKAITVMGRSMNPKRHRQHRTYLNKPFY